MDRIVFVRTFFFVLVMMLPLSVLPGYAQTPLGTFDGHTDVGSVRIPGSATYDVEAQEYLVEGSGANVWFDRELGRLVYNIEDDRYRLLTSGAGVDASTEIDPTQRVAGG
ncbi:MAG: hypothetical protein R3324_16590, partial [Halobacteriales archaeon]|nr:hypothetical protein [Halobacteriales archaeon]